MTNYYHVSLDTNASPLIEIGENGEEIVKKDYFAGGYPIYASFDGEFFKELVSDVELTLDEGISSKYGDVLKCERLEEVSDETIREFLNDLSINELLAYYVNIGKTVENQRVSLGKTK